jgi:hypothetical protein
MLTTRILLTALSFTALSALGAASAKCDTAAGKLFGGLMPAPTYLSAECGADYTAMRKQQAELAGGPTSLSNYELFWVAEKDLAALGKLINAGLPPRGYKTDFKPFKLAAMLGAQRADGAFSNAKGETWRVLINAADEANAGFTGKAKKPYFLIAFKLKP